MITSKDNNRLTRFDDNSFKHTTYVIWTTLSCYTAIFAILDNKLSLYFALSGIFITCPLSLHLQKKGYSHIAKSILIIACNFYIYIAGLSLSFQGGFDHHYYSCLVAGIVFFYNSNRKLIAISPVISITLYTISNMWGNNYLPDHFIMLDPYLELFRTINALSTAMIISIFILILQKFNQNIHSQNLSLIESENNELKDIRKKLLDAEKFANEQLTKLRQTEFHLNQSSRVAKVGGWSLDINTQKLWWSDQTYIIHDLPINSPIIVEEAINFYAEEARPIITEAVRQGIEFGTPWNLELPFVTAKKRRIWVHAVGECTTNPDGSKVLRGTFQDITEKINSENKLKKSHDAALKAAAAKSQFLANMSHEIRTPMNGILGNAELLMTEEITPSQKKYLDTIILSGNFMLQMLNDILDFSKIDAGQITLDIHSFDLKAQIYSIYCLFETSALNKGLYLNINIDPHIPQWVASDSTRIRQILSNLINNAIKFTEKGGVTITIKNINTHDEKKLIYFEIKDTGIGIEPEICERLFEEFVQADLSTTRKYGGTGLGLTICQRLANIMGSHISVSSHPNQGSCFSFSLEMNESSQPEYSSRAIHHKESSKNDDFKNLRVLIVEDNHINRDLAQNMLNRFNIDADIASNGSEAVQKVEKIHYDIILMDCHMPILDGYTATQHIRKLTLDKQPFIIAVTANAMHDDREKCLSIGMDEYISKPISQKKIKEAFMKYTKRLAFNKAV